MSRRDPWWLALLRWPLWSWQRLLGTVVGVLALGWAVGVGQNWLSAGQAAATTRLATGTTTTGPTATGTTTRGPATPSSALSPSSSALSPSSSALSPSSAASSGSSSAADGTGTGSPTASGSGASSAGSAIAQSPLPLVSAPGAGGAAAAADQFVRVWARPQLSAQAWWLGVKPLCTRTFADSIRQTDPARVPAQRVVGMAITVATQGRTAVVNVPTDAGLVEVHLVHETAGWLVTDVLPTGQPPGAGGSASAGAVG